MRSKVFGKLAVVLALSANLSLAAVGDGATDRITFQRDGERLTLHCEDVSADEVLQLLEGEGLATLSGPPGVSDRRVTIHVDGEPLEEVMRHLLQQAGVTNHAVRYDAKTGLATFVVLSEEAPKERPRRKRSRMAAADAEKPKAVPPALPAEDSRPRRAAPARTGPERGFGSLMQR